MVRCKFTCVEKKDNTDGSIIKLLPVFEGSEENKKFFNYTPWGEFNFGTINQEAAKYFKTGQEYYIDITVAE